MVTLTPFGEYIEAAREKRRLSRRAAARAALVNESYWRAVVAGASIGTRQTPAKPSLQAAVAMALAVLVNPVEAARLAGYNLDPDQVEPTWEEWRAQRTPDEPDTPPLPVEIDDLVTLYVASEDDERLIIRGQVRLLLDQLRGLLNRRRA